LISQNSETGKGGIQMIDVKSMQESFLCQWMIKLSHVDAAGTWTWVPSNLFQVFGRHCACFNTTVGSKTFKGLHLIKSVFWRQVALTWLNNNKTSLTGPPRMECLWNNNNIMYQKEVLFFQHWANKGITYVNDLLKDNIILSFDTIRSMLGPSPSLYLEYVVVYSAISKYLRRNPNYVHLTTEEHNHLLFNTNSYTTAKEIRCYNVEAKYSTPCAVQFWKNKFNFEISDICWNIAVNVTTESRLRELHWKILHNIYPTNILLKKMGLANSDLCPYCFNQLDFVEHFFFECSRIKPLWKHVENHILAQTSRRVLLDVKSILLGTVDFENVNRSHSYYISHLILVGKMCVSKYRYGTPIDITIMFEREIALRSLMYCQV
jgi:hypothetical protein